MAIRLSRVLSLLSLTFTAACNAVQDDFSRQLLTPPTSWLAEPADLGLAAEPFEIVLHADASLTGYWIPNPDAHGRTVVLFHDGGTNISVMQAYYSFLHDAGFQVVAFDPRGFGHSKGKPTLQAWIYDLPKLFDWLHARKDVDPNQIALYGTGIGSLAAMWAARTQGPCAALVVENLPSPRAMLQSSMANDGSLLGTYSVSWAEFAGLPENIEPVDNAPFTTAPALFITSDGEAARDQKSLLETCAEYKGPHQFWVLHDTGLPPHQLLTYDGEYERQITSFLASAFHGTPQLVTATSQKARDASDGQAWYEFDLTASVPFGERTAIEACAVLADGSMQTTRTWLEGGKGRVRMRLPSAPVQVSAMPVPGAVESAAETWVRQPTQLSLSGAAVNALWPRIEELRNEAMPVTAMPKLADELAAAEMKQPLHPRLEAELADVFARLGMQFFRSDDAATRERGRQLMQRAIHAVPAKPELHFWPGPTATYGFPQEDAVEQARKVLAASDAKATGKQ